VNEPGLPGENSNEQAPEIHCDGLIRNLKSSTTCEDHHDGVMVSIVSSSAWDHEFELW